MQRKQVLWKAAMAGCFGILVSMVALFFVFSEKAFANGNQEDVKGSISTRTTDNPYQRNPHECLTTQVIRDGYGNLPKKMFIGSCSDNNYYKINDYGEENVFTLKNEQETYFPLNFKAGTSTTSTAADTKKITNNVNIIPVDAYSQGFRFHLEVGSISNGRKISNDGWKKGIHTDDGDVFNNVKVGYGLLIYQFTTYDDNGEGTKSGWKKIENIYNRGGILEEFLIQEECDLEISFVYEVWKQINQCWSCRADYKFQFRNEKINLVTHPLGIDKEKILTQASTDSALNTMKASNGFQLDTVKNKFLNITVSYSGADGSTQDKVSIADAKLKEYTREGRYQIECITAFDEGRDYTQTVYVDKSKKPDGDFIGPRGEMKVSGSDKTVPCFQQSMTYQWTDRPYGVKWHVKDIWTDEHNVEWTTDFTVGEKNTITQQGNHQLVMWDDYGTEVTQGFYIGEFIPDKNEMAFRQKKGMFEGKLLGVHSQKTIIQSIIVSMPALYLFDYTEGKPEYMHTDALAFALDCELRENTEVSDGTYTYRGVTYSSNAVWTQAATPYAIERMEVVYWDPFINQFPWEAHMLLYYLGNKPDTSLNSCINGYSFYDYESAYSTQVYYIKVSDEPNLNIGDTNALKRAVGKYPNHTLEYGQGADVQLNKKNAPTGEYYFIEENIFGFYHAFAAYYEGICEAKLEVSYIDDNDLQGQRLITAANDGAVLQHLASFRLESYTDNIDCWSIIKVKKPNGTYEYMGVKDFRKKMYSTVGTYEMTCYNRLQKMYSFTCQITGMTEDFVLEGSNNLDENVRNNVRLYFKTGLTVSMLTKDFEDITLPVQFDSEKNRNYIEFLYTGTEATYYIELSKEGREEPYVVAFTMVA